ncbi:hypothetical protein ABZP36_001404 [Zizania latifolia]
MNVYLARKIKVEKKLGGGRRRDEPGVTENVVGANEGLGLVVGELERPAGPLPGVGAGAGALELAVVDAESRASRRREDDEASRASRRREDDKAVHLPSTRSTRPAARASGKKEENHRVLHDVPLGAINKYKTGDRREEKDLESTKERAIMLSTPRVPPPAPAPARLPSTRTTRPAARASCKKEENLRAGHDAPLHAINKYKTGDRREEKDLERKSNDEHSARPPTGSGAGAPAFHKDNQTGGAGVVQEGREPKGPPRRAAPPDQQGQDRRSQRREGPREHAVKTKDEHSARPPTGGGGGNEAGCLLGTRRAKSGHCYSPFKDAEGSLAAVGGGPSGAGQDGQDCGVQRSIHLTRGRAQALIKCCPEIFVALFLGFLDM